MLGGAVSPVVAYLQDKQLEPEDVAQLKTLIEQLEGKDSTGSVEDKQ